MTKLIEVILENVLKSKFGIFEFYYQPEHAIELFKMVIRPDYVIFRKNEGTDGTPLLVVEVKRTI